MTTSLIDPLPAYDDNEQIKSVKEDTNKTQEKTISPLGPEEIYGEMQPIIITHSICDLFVGSLFDVLEVTAIVSITIVSGYFARLPGGNATHFKYLFIGCLVACIPLIIIELWLCYIGIIGKITNNGKNWYRISSHWSMLFTRLLFPARWKLVREQWRNTAKTIINTPRYNSIRLSISFIIAMVCTNSFTQIIQNPSVYNRKCIKPLFFVVLWISWISAIYRFSRCVACCCFKQRKPIKLC